MRYKSTAKKKIKNSKYLAQINPSYSLIVYNVCVIKLQYPSLFYLWVMGMYIDNKNVISTATKFYTPLKSALTIPFKRVWWFRLFFTHIYFILYEIRICISIFSLLCLLACCLLYYIQNKYARILDGSCLMVVMVVVTLAALLYIRCYFIHNQIHLFSVYTYFQ